MSHFFVLLSSLKLCRVFMRLSALISHFLGISTAFSINWVPDMDKMLSKQKYWGFCANAFGMSKWDSAELTLTFLFALPWQWDARDWAWTVGIIHKLLAKIVAHYTGLGSSGQWLCVTELYGFALHCKSELFKYLARQRRAWGWPHPNVALLLSGFLVDSRVCFILSLI